MSGRVAALERTWRSSEGGGTTVAAAPSVVEVPPARPVPRGPRLGRLTGDGGLLGDSPRRLWLWLASLVLLAVVTGLVGGYQIDDRSTVVDDVALRSGALSTTELDLYQSLSDADATAASAFLAGGLEPPKQRKRYEAAIARASAALATAADGAPSDQNDTITTLSVNLPVYTGLVERARAYNRQDLPLGAAYLREASWMMRDTLLPAAQQLQEDEAKRLAAAQDDADAWLWFAVLLVLVLLGCVLVAQVRLARRTNRVFNNGLLAATAATLVAGIWLAVASTGAAAHVGASRADGSAQLAVLAEARIATLQARSDEAMTLIARGGGAEFEEHFTGQFKRLAGVVGSGGLLRKARAQATEDDVRKAHNAAVERAIGDAPNSAGSLAAKLDGQLTRAIRYVSDRFDSEAGAARSVLFGVGYALALLMAVTVVGVVIGLQQRIREYR